MEGKSFIRNAILGMAAVGLLYIFQTSGDRKATVDFEEDAAQESNRTHQIKTKRAPASITQIKKAPPSLPIFREKKRENGLEKMEYAEESKSPQVGSAAGISNGYSTTNSDRGVRRPTPYEPTPTKNKTSPSDAAKTKNGFSPVGGLFASPKQIYPAPGSSSSTSSSGATAPTSSGSSNSNSGPTSLTCSASIGGGSYHAPQMLGLTCSGAADIRYCVQAGSCCDPDSGLTYSAPFAIGMTQGTYCVSARGFDADNSLESNLVQQTFVFNAEIPHLVVTHPKQQFQTGQLAGLMSFTSDGFGEPNHQAGIINLRTHDPSPAGLNLTCDNIVDDHASLTAPTSIVVMTPTSTTGFNPTTELEVFLTAANLDYGDNFMATYLSSSIYGPVMNACSTQKIRLEDFEFFDSEPVSQVTSVALDSELIGGFTTHGFFEQDANLYRGPAGSTIDNQQNQELRSGMLGIFF